MTPIQKQKQDDITNILLETTPLYKDLIGLVMEYYVEPEPAKFKVGDTFQDKLYYWHQDRPERYFKLVKRTRCYVDYRHARRNKLFDTIERRKIREDSDGNEYIICFENKVYPDQYIWDEKLR
jgi:hypothetical protein